MNKESVPKNATGPRKVRKASPAGVAPSDKSKIVPDSQLGFGSQVAALFAECGLDEPIQEFHGYFVKPMKFEL